MNGMTKKMKTGTTAMLIVFAMAIHAEASTVLIDPTTRNGSFELVNGVASAAVVTHWDTDSDGDVDNWTNWTEIATATNDSGTYAGPSPSDGTRVAFLQPGNAAYNLTSHVIAEGDVFTYSFDNVRGGRPAATIQLVYDDGGTITAIAGSDESGGPIATISDTFTVLAGNPAIGKVVGIGLSTAGSYPEIDNVLLSVEAASVPAPAALPAGLLAMGLIASRRRRTA